jgi:mono/diheme cytochrome c family protein
MKATWLLPLLANTAFALEFDGAQQQLKKYCVACHSDANPVGGFKLSAVAAQDSLTTQARRWTSLANRVRNFEMPPKGAPAPSLEEREALTKWIDGALHQAACATGPAAGPAPIRRLNRDEYAATIRDLLDIHLDLAKFLPIDGGGGEGFDNAAETLSLSPLHTEKYLDAAKFIMDYASREYKSRAKIFTAKTAREILANFLPRAFRRPVSAIERKPYEDLYELARKQGQTHEEAVFFTIRAVLVSPLFLFRAEAPNYTSAARPVDQHALASRISYFLWGSMPDELLTDLAASGRLNDPEVLQQITKRMLRSDRSLSFAVRFTDQWLHIRELNGEKAPDAKLFPEYAKDEELSGDIRNQPSLYFRELLVRNRPVLDLIDSTHTIGSRNLERHFGFKLPLDPGRRAQPQWTELPKDSNRGGLLGMPAVLAVSSYPYRTSPVLRGAWVLEAILGTPPPPPPPNVPSLEEPQPGHAKTMRERLAQHRSNPTCAGCHSRIDGIGFALDNYDAIGRWRAEDAGKPIDASGELNDGTRMTGPDGLKKLLLDRKDLFVRHLTAKMLGYALGRGLTLKDSCTVDAIAAEVKQNGYSIHTLVTGIVLSQPFRMQSPTPGKETVKR